MKNMQAPTLERLLAAYPALAVLTGAVRVSHGSPGGRELELYRVQAGEMCLVSSASLFAGQAMAHEPFRDFVLGLFAARMADELGTVREIVTRLLRRFERKGAVELSRKCITIRDSAALRALATSPV